MDGTKRVIRQEMRRRRRAISAAELATAEQAVAAHVAALASFRDQPALIAYVATDGEVPTGALVEAAFAAGKRVYLPRLVGETLCFAEHRRGSNLRPGALGIPEPLGSELEEGEVAGAFAVVPLLAWDESGSRVGRGGGHYDRAFGGAARPACLVGLGYTFQQCPSLPREPWDLQLDWVVTERGALRCWGRDDPSRVRKEGATPNDNNDIRYDGGGRRGAGRRPGLAGGLHPAPAGSGPGSRHPGNGRSGAH
jgi:5-formyltetrahydrofolate cyclo-ligase